MVTSYLKELLKCFFLVRSKGQKNPKRLQNLCFCCVNKAFLLRSVVIPVKPVFPFWREALKLLVSISSCTVFVFLLLIFQNALGIFILIATSRSYRGLHQGLQGNPCFSTWIASSSPLLYWLWCLQSHSSHMFSLLSPDEIAPAQKLLPFLNTLSQVLPLPLMGFALASYGTIY